MQEQTVGNDNLPADHDKVIALSAALIAQFGPQACDVIEAQIAAFGEDLNRSIWTSVWEDLCAQRARRA